MAQSPPVTPSSNPSAAFAAKEASMSGGASAAGSESPTHSQSGGSGAGAGEYPPQSTSPLQLTPSLDDVQIGKIRDTAAAIVKTLPPTAVESKTPNNKKKISKELEFFFQFVICMPNDDPRKMEEIRRFSAIYGRFDCKRKPEKPLTLHEVCVNEASAQLCYMMPNLLTRRDELFPLARQIVRDSGYQYSKGHSRSQFQQGFPSKLFGQSNTTLISSTNGGASGGGSIPPEDSQDSNSSTISGSAPKRPRRTTSRGESASPRRDSESLSIARRRERLDEISDDLRALAERQEELKASATSDNLGLLQQQMDVLKAREAHLRMEREEHARAVARHGYSGPGRTSTSSDRGQIDADDSGSSYSNASSPIVSGPADRGHHAGFVLSQRGGQIIAVQNPALSLSTALRTSTAAESSVASSSSTVASSSAVAAAVNLSRTATSSSSPPVVTSSRPPPISRRPPGSVSPVPFVASDDNGLKQEPSSPK